jgi:uncharacterized protein (TIGR00299 family) protein
MRIAYLDCFAGLSGDMFLGAWFDAGLISSEQLTKRLALLGLGKVRLDVRSVLRCSIRATKVDIKITAKKEETRSRSLRDIQELIGASGLTDAERGRALAIFQLLAEAEGHVHGMPTEDVHFHEIGALDSICDIVGAAIVIEELKIKRWYASKINMGSGTISTQHGVFPVPAPATVELLKGIPTYSSGIEAELVTPTGAAILRHLEPEFRMPPARWEAVGYGAGTRELEIPNTLRVLIGQSLERPIEVREVFLIETDIDDMNPQFLPYVQESLSKQGAQDVSWHALQMKKGRTGFRLCVLTTAEKVDALCELIFRETTTLGLRIHVVEKRMLDREIITVVLPQGKVRVKLGRLGKAIFNVMPEYEDCRALAEASGLPLKEIESLARAAAERRLKQKKR